MARGQQDEAQRMMEELEDNEPAESAATSSETPSIVRRASLLLKLGQQVSFLAHAKCAYLHFGHQGSVRPLRHQSIAYPDAHLRSASSLPLLAVPSK